jgi:hypothetical protein
MHTPMPFYSVGDASVSALPLCIGLVSLLKGAQRMAILIHGTHTHTRAQELLILKTANSVKERGDAEREPGECSGPRERRAGILSPAWRPIIFLRMTQPAAACTLLVARGQQRIRSRSLVWNALKGVCKSGHLQVFGGISKRSALVEPEKLCEIPAVFKHKEWTECTSRACGPPQWR